jgi:hypothetical protein
MRFVWVTSFRPGRYIMVRAIGAIALLGGGAGFGQEFDEGVDDGRVELCS